MRRGRVGTADSCCCPCPRLPGIRACRATARLPLGGWWLRHFLVYLSFLLLVLLLLLVARREKEEAEGIGEGKGGGAGERFVDVSGRQMRIIM